MNYGMFYRTIFFFFFFCMKVLDTKELLYSVYVKYYNNVLLKKKDSQIFPYLLKQVEHFCD